MTDAEMSGQTLKHGTKWDRPSPAVDRYLSEEDAWKKFLVVGEEEQDTIKAVSQDSLKWYARLASIDQGKKDAISVSRSSLYVADLLTMILLPGKPKLC